MLVLVSMSAFVISAWIQGESLVFVTTVQATSIVLWMNVCSVKFAEKKSSLEELGCVCERKKEMEKESGKEMIKSAKKLFARTTARAMFIHCSYFYDSLPFWILCKAKNTLWNIHHMHDTIAYTDKRTNTSTKLWIDRCRQNVCVPVLFSQSL